MEVYTDAELYCAAFAGPVDRELGWLLEQTGPVSAVLEPFCGDGRYAEEFVRRGVRYFGLDATPSMLGRAPSGDGITLIHGDAREFALERRFPLAWCPINSLTHLSDSDDIRAHLRCVRSHLEEGGLYVVEMEVFRHDGPWEDGAPERSRWSEPQADGTVVDAEVSRVDCDLAAGTFTERAVYRRLRDGHVLAESRSLFTMKMWTYDDLLALTADGGYRIERVFRHESPTSRPEVPLDRSLENEGSNHYFFLRAD